MDFRQVYIGISGWSLSTSIAVCTIEILHFSNLIKEILKASWKKPSLLSIIRLFTSAWFISSSLNSVGLSRTSLSISEDWAIVPLEALINNWFPNYLEYFFLRSLFISNIIKCVWLLSIVISCRHNDSLLVFDISDTPSSIVCCQTHSTHVVHILLKWCVSSKVNICLSD